jgi:ornithine decarboxylase
MAYFELSKKVLFEKYNELKKLVDVVAYNHKVNPEVGKVLDKETDIIFVLSSLNAVEEIKNKQRIVYIIQGETREELTELYEKGINSFIVDNNSDLERLLELKKGINLYLRMKFKEHTMYTGKYFVYGFSWQRINELIQELKENKLITTLNLHFHRRTQNVGEWDILDEFKDAISKENFEYIDKVNIGGGLPGKYINSNPDTKVIFEKIKQFRDFLNKNKMKLMIEPGRYIAASSIKLITFIKNKYENNLILDCSIFNAYMDTYLMHMRLPVLDEQEKGGITYLLKGISPDSLDIFRYRVNLPKEKQIGDKIIFENAGAYNFHTEFAELPKLETKIMDDFK